MANLDGLTISDTGFLGLPRGTTAERPGSPSVGYLRFNTDLNVIEVFDGSEWVLQVPTNVVTDGLVLYLDAANIESFRGEPTTNLTINDKDFTGTTYSPLGEWTSSPTVFTKSYYSNIKTPVGFGATLLSESGNTGAHHLSRFGGSETGNHSLSCYVYPISNTIDNFTIGLLGSNVITFNLINKSISYGSGTVANSAFIEEVPGYPGWLRVGGTHNGRVGGWVGSLGLSVNTTYTGTAGGRPFYIAGLQYETTPKPTLFTPAGTSRGTTVASGGGWSDLSGNSNDGTLVNGVGYDSGNSVSLSFDGVDDAVEISNFPTIFSNSVCMCGWFYFDENNTRDILFGSYNVADSINFEKHTDNRLRLYWNQGEKDIFTGNNVISAGAWQYISIQRNKENQTFDFFVNSILVNQQSVTATDVTTSRTFRIGRDSRTGTTALKGNIAQLSMYNRSLTPQEIQQNFNATKGRFGL